MSKPNLIPTNELIYSDFELKNIDAMSQCWKDQKSYRGYSLEPRPYSGFMLVCGDDDIEITFSSSVAEEKRYTLSAKKNNIVYIPCGCMYSVGLKGRAVGIDDYLINFNMDISGREAIFSDRPEIICGNGSTYLKAFEELAAAFRTPRRMPSRIKSLLYNLTWLLLTKELISNDFYPIKKGIVYLEKHWNEDSKISEIAELCGVSESYFRRVFRNFSGHSPVEYRNMLRISAARSMLLDGDRSIKDIALSVGFDDCFYFSRIFKKLTGLSPSEYQKQNNISLQI